MKIEDLKFRAWDNDKKEMYYQENGFGFQFHPATWYVLAPETDEIVSDYSKCELMQFIGRRDKNDTPIYDGDILESKTRKRIVKSSDVFSVPTFCEEYYKIVGNVFQNPDLTNCLNKHK